MRVFFYRKERKVKKRKEHKEALCETGLPFAPLKK